jgi:hypothetical protein
MLCLFCSLNQLESSGVANAGAQDSAEDSCEQLLRRVGPLRES